MRQVDEDEDLFVPQLGHLYSKKAENFTVQEDQAFFNKLWKEENFEGEVVEVSR